MAQAENNFGWPANGFDDLSLMRARSGSIAPAKIAKHVDSAFDISSDVGSTPTTSTKFLAVT